MIPVARTANILITEVDNEVMIYDRERDDCHCLNPIATKVYYYADGRNTVDDIATFLEQELELSEDLDIRGLVWLALEELEKCDLIKEYLREPLPNVLKMSRRKVLGKTTKLAGAAAIGVLFPMIQSVIAPKPVMAASQNCNTVICACAGKGSVSVQCCPPTKGGSCNCTGSQPVATC
jgi:hypothetical protein